jgi:hypothetical protein
MDEMNNNMPQGQMNNQMSQGNQGNMGTNMNSNSMPPKKENSLMKLILALVLVIILALVINASDRKEMEELNTQINQKQSEIKINDEQVKKIEVQGESDTVADIEADLNATNVDAIDQ